MPTVAIDARDAHLPRPRGFGRYTRELVAALERQAPGTGIDLRVLTEGGSGPELAWEQLALPRLLRREAAAAVHSPNAFLPLRRPCPGVITVHDLAFETHPDDFSRRTGWKFRTFVPRAARSAELVICSSEFARDALADHYAIDPDKTRVVSLGSALASGEGEPPPGPYVLAVGDLRRKKNLLRLVEAFAAVRAAGAPHRLVLAGLDSGEGGRIAEAAGDAPVELTGYVDDERLDALMRGAELLVHPSLHEGFGLVVVEAMARGCPVALARASALPETGGEAAAYFDPYDVADIAATIGRLLGDPSERARLAELGCERARGFSWDDAARHTLDVYAELIG